MCELIFQEECEAFEELDCGLICGGCPFAMELESMIQSATGEI